MALENERAFADLSHFRVFAVSDSDASPWLDGLLSVRITTLEPGHARRSLFLDPAGHVQADLQVLRTGEALLLLQDPGQTQVRSSARPAPVAVGRSARRSDRRANRLLRPKTRGDLRAALDGRSVRGGPRWRVGHRGRSGARPRNLRFALWKKLVPVRVASPEAARIRSGIPRFPIDVTQASTPAETPVSEACVDLGNEDFPGRDALTRARDFGHPAVVVAAFWTRAEVEAGEPVIEGRDRARVVTSALPTPAGTSLIARVRWSPTARRRLRTARGAQLHRSGPLIWAPMSEGWPRLSRVSNVCSSLVARGRHKERVCRLHRPRSRRELPFRR